jgi:hypothetical protein
MEMAPRLSQRQRAKPSVARARDMADRPRAEPMQDMRYASTGVIGPFIYECICMDMGAEMIKDNAGACIASPQGKGTERVYIEDAPSLNIPGRLWFGRAFE